MSDMYILVNGVAEPVTDSKAWSTWMKANHNTQRRVGLDVVGNYRVSTVFLGLNHRYGDGDPLLFETMVFENGSWSDLECDRCSTLEEAKGMHAKTSAQRETR